MLLRRYGWEAADDIQEDFSDTISDDNGQTWSEPVASLSSSLVEGGTIIRNENAGLYLPERDSLIVLADESFQPRLEAEEGFKKGHRVQLRISVSSPGDYLAAKATVHDFGLPNGLAVSFCHPACRADGCVMVPVQFQSKDDDQGSLRAMGIEMDPATGLMLDYWQVALLIGRYTGSHTLDWQLGGSVPLAPGLSSRGLCEGTPMQLRDGRIAMICRGSNHLWMDRPGCKWVTMSEDGGVSWTPAQPLLCDDGSLLESSATGSLLLRAEADGKAYWVGNLCLQGCRARGNYPRSPLVIAQVDEDSMTLMRDSITIIDQAREGEHADTQHSNFRLYQDRQTGELVLFLTRYGQRGYEHNDWLKADHYQYRVRLDD